MNETCKVLDVFEFSLWAKIKVENWELQQNMKLQKQGKNTNLHEIA